VVDIQTVSIMLASASVVAGIVYYAFQLRHQSKIRQTDLIMRLCSTWASKELSDATLKVWNLEFKDARASQADITIMLCSTGQYHGVRTFTL
jgi:hypothetical protein